MCKSVCWGAMGYVPCSPALWSWINRILSWDSISSSKDLQRKKIYEAHLKEVGFLFWRKTEGQSTFNFSSKILSTLRKGQDYTAQHWILFYSNKWKRPSGSFSVPSSQFQKGTREEKVLLSHTEWISDQELGFSDPQNKALSSTNDIFHL